MFKNRTLKTSTILLLCFTVLFSSSFTTLAATPTKDVTSKVILLGNPFNKATFAKNVWDMQVYNGRIYLGSGDCGKNSGATPVIYYDPATKNFATQFKVDEEQIDQYKVLNGKLYIPGTDATESWDFGNFYTMDNDKWTKFRTVPNANHVWDMAFFNGQLYAATGTSKPGKGELLKSTDMGKTWVSQVPQDKRFYAINDWVTSLFELNNNLYATGTFVNPSTSTISIFGKFSNLLVTNNINTIAQPYGSSFLPGVKNNYLFGIKRQTTLGNNLIYLGVRLPGINDLWSPDAMYVATGITPTRRVAFPALNALPTDIVTRGNSVYVLTYIKNSNNSYTNVVYKSDDLKNWTELFRFNTVTFARSFEEIDGDFYFGLGCSYNVLAPSTGSILKVDRTTY
ncbi:MAG: hypothetical protein WA131_01425 [Desulfitobacteriaceae bacterium]